MRFRITPMTKAVVQEFKLLQEHSFQQGLPDFNQFLLKNSKNSFIISFVIQTLYVKPVFQGIQ